MVDALLVELVVGDCCLSVGCVNHAKLVDSWGAHSLRMLAIMSLTIIVRLYMRGWRSLVQARSW